MTLILDSESINHHVALSLLNFPFTIKDMCSFEVAMINQKFQCLPQTNLQYGCTEAVGEFTDAV